MALRFLAPLVANGTVQVVEPGVVRDELLSHRIGAGGRHLARRRARDAGAGARRPRPLRNGAEVRGRGGADGRSLASSSAPGCSTGGPRSSSGRPPPPAPATTASTSSALGRVTTASALACGMAKGRCHWMLEDRPLLDATIRIPQDLRPLSGRTHDPRPAAIGSRNSRARSRECTRHGRVNQAARRTQRGDTMRLHLILLGLVPGVVPALASAADAAAPKPFSAYAVLKSEPVAGAAGCRVSHAPRAARSGPRSTRTTPPPARSPGWPARRSSSTSWPTRWPPRTWSKGSKASRGGEAEGHGLQAARSTGSIDVRLIVLEAREMGLTGAARVPRGHGRLPRLHAPHHAPERGGGRARSPTPPRWTSSSRPP